MKNNKSKLINLYFFFLGICWISFHIYIRFLRDKTSYNLIEIKAQLNNFHYALFIVFIFSHFIIIFSIVLSVYRQYRNKQPSLIVIKISEKLNHVLDIIYWKPLEYIHDKIAPKIPGSARFFIFLESIWTENSYGEKYFYTMIFFFDVLPKITVSLTFFIEIALYGQMKYFPYVLSIILIPVLFSIFIKLFISCSIRNIPVLTNYFSEITGFDPIINKNGEIIGYNYYEWVVKPEYEDVIDPKEEISYLIQLENMQCYGTQIKKDINKIAPYITLFTSTIYLLGGLYRLIILW